MRLLPTSAKSLIGMVGTVAAVAAASVLWHELPTTTDIYAPFDVAGAPGVPVHGRNLSATVTGARIADRVVADSVLTRAPIAAVGRWIVVDTTMVTTLNPAAPHAELLAGPNTYRPADRLPAGTTLGGPLQPGIAERGGWVFDVAPALLAPHTSVVLRLWDDDGRLDTRLRIPLALDDSRVIRVDSVSLARPVRAAA